VLVIPLENHSQSEALAQMPNLTSWAKTYGQATNYSAVAHPSLPNYLAIFGGSTFGVTSDCSVGQSGCVATAPSVWGQTLAAGKTAKAYQESMTSNCQTGGSGSYAPRHGPWPYWVDSAERAGCGSNDVPSGTTSSGALLNDINAGTLPVTGELTPNLCNDAHDCALSTADNWLAGWMPKLMGGPDYRGGRLTIIVTFDEDDGSQSNKVAFVAIDPRLAGKSVTGTFNHYSLTRWLDDNAGVARLRSAANAPDLRAAFGL
jgi:acid phosphatase